jgi:AraC-like DNA-binding protein
MIRTKDLLQRDPLRHAAGSMPAVPALIRPRPFEGDFGPFVEVERQGGSADGLIAIERFAPQPAGICVENPTLRLCRHLDRPLRFMRKARGGRLGGEFIAPGQHFVFAGGSEAVFSWEEGFRALSITVSAEALRSATGFELPPVQVRGEDAVLERLTSLALIDAMEGFPRGPLFAEGLALAAAAHLVGCGTGGRVPVPPGTRNTLSVSQLRTLRELIEAKLPERPTLQELAAAVEYPAPRLGGAFRRSTGMSLWAYAAGRRLELAERLLLVPGASLGSVASQAGYSSQAHMTTGLSASCGA